MHKKRKPGIFVTHKRYVRRPGDNRKTMRVKMRGHAIVCFNIPDKIAAKIIKDIEAGKGGVWRNFVTVVSDRDFKTIMAALDDPQEPNEKLKEIMRLHKEVYHGGDEE